MEHLRKTQKWLHAYSWGENQGAWKTGAKGLFPHTINSLFLHFCLQTEYTFKFTFLLLAGLWHLILFRVSESTQEHFAFVLLKGWWQTYIQPQAVREWPLKQPCGDHRPTLTHEQGRSSSPEERGAPTCWCPLAISQSVRLEYTKTAMDCPESKPYYLLLYFSDSFPHELQTESPERGYT